MPGPRLTRKRPRNFTRPGRTYPAPTGRWFRYAVCTFDVPAGVFLSARSDVSAVIFGLGNAGFCGAVHCVCGLCRPCGPPHRRPGNPDLGRVLAGAVADVPAVRLPAGAAGHVAVDGVAHFRRLVRAGPLRNAGPGAQRQAGFGLPVIFGRENFFRASKSAYSSRSIMPDIGMIPSPRHSLSHGVMTFSISFMAAGLPSGFTTLG